MKSIVWLASYPKSGNTWVRALIANYLFAKTKPLAINQLHRVGLGDSITALYQSLTKKPVNTADIQQYLQLRNKVLQGIVNNGASINFVKTHNANLNLEQQPLIPLEYTHSVIYIVRHPLDVVVSYSNQLNLPFEKAIEMINNKNSMIPGDKRIMPQFICDWSTHFNSWSKEKRYPVTIVRYEDLITNTATELKRIVTAIGLPYDETKIQQAVSFSNINELKKQEELQGFVENANPNRPFFASGEVDHWKQSLNQNQITRVKDRHHQSMEKLGY